MKKIYFILIITFVVISGCSRTERYAATGAALGGFTGHVLGNSTESTIVGAGVGAAAGAIIGSSSGGGHRSRPRRGHRR